MEWAGCGLRAVLRQQKAARAECTCAGAAHRQTSLTLCFGGFLVPVSPDIRLRPVTFTAPLRAENLAPSAVLPGVSSHLAGFHVVDLAIGPDAGAPAEGASSLAAASLIASLPLADLAPGPAAGGPSSAAASLSALLPTADLAPGSSFCVPAVLSPPTDSAPGPAAGASP